MNFKWKKFKMRRGSHICMMCGLCVASCPKGALRFNKSREDLTWDDEIIYDPKKCSGCGKCADVCPEEMIKIIKLKNAP